MRALGLSDAAQAPILSIFFAKLFHRWSHAIALALPHFHLILDTLQPQLVLDDRLHHLVASVGDFLDGRQPVLLRWKSCGGMGHGGHHLLGIARQDRRDCGHIGCRIIGFPRAIAAEQKLRAGCRVNRRRFVLGHRIRQLFGRDRQRLE